MSEFLPSASLHYKAGRENLVPDALFRTPYFLAALKLTTEDRYPLAFCNSVVSAESYLISCLAITQERDSRYLLEDEGRRQGTPRISAEH